jgi:hypothetical protein
MTAWIARILWKLRGRRQVRIQLVANAGAIDGVLIGVVAGHYRLRNAFFYTNSSEAKGSEMLGETWIPKDRVFLLNVKN